MGRDKLNFVVYSNMLFDPFVGSSKFENANPDEIYDPNTVYKRQDCRFYDLENYLNRDKNSCHFTSLFLNIRSLPKHIEKFRHDFIAGNEIDVLCFAEMQTHELFNIQNYNMFINNRNRRGGGVACYVHETFLSGRVNNNLCLMEACIESLFVDVSLSNKSKRLIGCIYRPHNTDINVFIARLAYLREDISKDYKKL